MWCLSASKLLTSEKGQCQSCPYWKNGGCSWTDKHDTPPCDCWVWDGSRPSAPRWINVKDRLPARNHTVLGVVKMLPDGARTINKVRLTHAGNWVFFEDNVKVRHLESVVTHWAELPELPEEEEDGDSREN